MLKWAPSDTPSYMVNAAGFLVVMQSGNWIHTITSHSWPSPVAKWLLLAKEITGIPS